MAIFAFNFWMIWQKKKKKISQNWSRFGALSSDLFVVKSYILQVHWRILMKLGVPYSPCAEVSQKISQKTMTVPYLSTMYLHQYHSQVLIFF